MSFRYVTLLVTITLFFILSQHTVFGSAGDKSPEYRSCYRNCIQQTSCTVSRDSQWSLGWSCADECDYDCAQLVTRQRMESGKPVQQFHGKWPLTRWIGIQEPASVLFSLANLVPYALWLKTWLRQRKSLRQSLPKNHPAHVYVLLYTVSTVVGINTWFWSAVFHSRDRWWTERLDYACAEFLIGYQAYVAFMRLSSPRLVTNRRYLITCAVILSSLWLFGASKAGLLSYRIDYGINTLFGLVLGLTNATMWCTWSYMHSSTDHPLRYRPMLLVIFLFAALSLELIELPNGTFYSIIDTHSLWHLATAPASVWWSRFFFQDLLWIIQNKQRLS